MTYNRLRSAKIQGFILGTLFFTVNIIIWIRLLSTHHDFGQADLIRMTIIFYGPIILLYFFRINQVIESYNSSMFVTYYKVGPFKFGYKRFDKPSLDKVTIEQDDKRYYCLTIQIPNRQSMTLERYPTLDKANERFQELKEVLS